MNPPHHRLTIRERSERECADRTKAFRNHILGAAALIVYAIIVRFA